MIGTSVSHYRIVEKIGSGGMGVVYRAEDLRLGRFVAIKFLTDEIGRNAMALGLFQREARAASALNHPNVCTIHDVGDHDGQPFIVMEFLEGQTLNDLMGKGPLPTEKALELAVQIVDGLEHAHAHGIFHRDVKPANIFIKRSMNS
jgi:serine/threonine protein kinase